MIPPSRGRALLLALGVALVFVLPRAWLAQRQGLWADEAFSLAMATGHSLEHPAALADPSRGDFTEGVEPRPAAEWAALMKHEPATSGVGGVLRAVRISDTNPPLYYVLLHGWTRAVGTSDLALRSFSILCALLSLPLVHTLARRVGGRAAAWPALLLFTGAPLSLYYSTEGRMYALVWLATLANVAAALAWREGRSRWAAAAWIATSALGLWTHYFFTFAWAALALALALWPGRARRVSLALAVAACALIAAPWYAGIPAQLAAWRVTGDWLNVEPPEWSGWREPLEVLVGFLSGRGVWGGGTRAHAVAVVLALSVLATLLRAWRAKNVRGPRALLWLWLLAPVLGLALFDAWRGTYALSQQRYALAGLPAAVLLAGAAFARWPARVRWPALLLLAALWLPAARTMATNSARCSSPFRQFASALSSEARDGDVVIVHSIPSGLLCVARYARSDLRLAAWVEQLGVRQPERDLAALRQGKQRVLLVRAHEVYAAAPVQAELERRAVLERSFSRETLHLFVYVLRQR